MKICVAFFGITRSLSHTKDSILENVLSPLSAFFDVEIVAHFYENFDETAKRAVVNMHLTLRRRSTAGRFIYFRRLLEFSPSMCIVSKPYPNLRSSAFACR